MSIETKYICDVCGAVRGETNHWFEAQQSGSPLAIAPFVGLRGQMQVCGSKCAHALLDRWLTTGKLESEQSEVAV